MNDYELLPTVFSKPVSIICATCRNPIATGIAIVLILEKGKILSCVGTESICCLDLPREIPLLFETVENFPSLRLTSKVIHSGLCTSFRG